MQTYCPITQLSSQHNDGGIHLLSIYAFTFNPIKSAAMNLSTLPRMNGLFGWLIIYNSTHNNVLVHERDTQPPERSGITSVSSNVHVTTRDFRPVLETDPWQHSSQVGPWDPSRPRVHQSRDFLNYERKGWIEVDKNKAELTRWRIQCEWRYSRPRRVCSMYDLMWAKFNTTDVSLIMIWKKGKGSDGTSKMA